MLLKSSIMLSFQEFEFVKIDICAYLHDKWLLIVRVAELIGKQQKGAWMIVTPAV